VLGWIRKRLTLRSYRRKLGPALVKRYGRERFYSVNQIRTTVDKLGLNTDYICYAYAEYCTRDDFDAHHVSTGEACDWTEMREEWSSSWGVGDHHYSVSEHGGHYGDSHHHDDSYDGHHGGGHDGGHHH
jgi:hypothetical protein